MKLMVLIALAVVFGFAPSAKAEPDIRPPREVLPGHWKDVAGKLHYYFDKDQITMVSGGELIGSYPFEIVEENNAECMIKLKLTSDDANLRTIRVEFHRKGFMETFRVKGVTLNNIMLYVDDKRTP